MTEESDKKKQIIKYTIIGLVVVIVLVIIGVIVWFLQKKKKADDSPLLVPKADEKTTVPSPLMPLELLRRENLYCIGQQCLTEPDLKMIKMLFAKMNLNDTGHFKLNSRWKLKWDDTVFQVEDQKAAAERKRFFYKNLFRPWPRSSTVPEFEVRH